MVYLIGVILLWNIRVVEQPQEGEFEGFEFIALVLEKECGK